MKKTFLLSVAALSVSLSLGAQSMQLQKTNPIVKQIPAKQAENVVKSRSLGNGIVEKVVKLPNGLEMKVVSGVEKFNNIINPAAVKTKAIAKADLKEGYILYEDFEAWDGNNNAWLPDGWAIDHKDSPQSDRGWKMTKPESIYDVIDSKCLTYELFDDEVDEWVMTPEVLVEPGMQLCWETMTSPYFYNWDYINWGTGQFDTVEILNDIIVNISEDGGQTWTKVFSHAEKLLETAADFYAMFDYSMRPFTLSLSDYEGKSIMVGFQIKGKGGNTTFIDNVSVGLPDTKVSYSRPLSNLYFGLTDTDEYFPRSVMVGPVFEPVTYTNTSKTTGASFTWTYDDSDAQGNVSSDRNLTVTYKTDHSSPSTSRNNIYDFPVLSGVSPTTAPAEFTYNQWFQAGGKGEYERYYTDTQEYEVMQLGLTVADPITEGTATFADIGLPYFGYNQASDQYWSEYTFGLGGMDDNNWAHLEKYGDFFYTPDSPLVIEGVRANAYGKVSRNTRFTVEIYPINKAYQPAAEPIATAVCTGDDITIVDRYSSNDFLSLNFTFDEPLVLTKDEVPFFIVAIGGFRDADNVEYFSPEMSANSNPNKLGLGWVGKWICFGGTMMPFSWTPVANYTEDELVSFYIMLDAAYPWMESETDKVEITGGGTATLTLDSFHEGEKIEFENMPSWLWASAEGRYDKTVVTFVAAASEIDDEATVTVKAPGVTKQVTIARTAGVGSVVADSDNSAAQIYTLTGRRVVSDELLPGVYIMRRADGSVTKFVKK